MSAKRLLVFVLLLFGMYKPFYQVNTTAVRKIFIVGSVIRIDKMPNLPDYASIDIFSPFRRVDIREYSRLSGKSTNQTLGMIF